MNIGKNGNTKEDWEASSTSESGGSSYHTANSTLGVRYDLCQTMVIMSRWLSWPMDTRRWNRGQILNHLEIYLLTIPNSEFPSLSNNQPQPSQSTWAAQSARTAGPPISMRTQPSHPANAQQQSQQQQEDLFASSSQLPSSRSVFRFNQNAVGSPTHPQSSDDFPPLSRNTNGDIGQARGPDFVPGSAFGAQGNGMGFGSVNPPPTQNRNNGLLDVLSGNRIGPSNRATSSSTGKRGCHWFDIDLLIAHRTNEYKIPS